MHEAGLPVAVRIEGQQVPLPPGVDLSAYRILQEALTNTIKHAGPATAEVMLRYHPSALELQITDTGTATAPGSGSGHGLIGMRERIILLGGELHTAACDGGGYQVRARLPLTAANGTRP